MVYFYTHTFNSELINVEPYSSKHISYFIWNLKEIPKLFSVQGKGHCYSTAGTVRSLLPVLMLISSSTASESGLWFKVLLLIKKKYIYILPNDFSYWIFQSFHGNVIVLMFEMIYQSVFSQCFSVLMLQLFYPFTYFSAWIMLLWVDPADGPKWINNFPYFKTLFHAYAPLIQIFPLFLLPYLQLLNDDLLYLCIASSLT